MRLKIKLMFCWTAAFLAAGLLPSMAQSGTQAAASSAEGMTQSMSLPEIIQMGGWLMYVLGAMSIIGLAMIVYFLIVLRQEQMVPRNLVVEVRKKLLEGRIDQVRELCGKKASPMSVIVLSALDHLKGVEQPDPGLLKEIIEGEGNRQASLIQNQTQYLMDIGVIAPMIGLLGTVMGMLKAFNAVALDLAKAKPMLLAAGVSQALITTVAGLLVAIPAMIAYAYFRGKSARILAQLETFSAELMTLLLRKKNV
ncbi:MAG: MotA/TolQ/ExbB proton channel family protein [Lentisphaerota bacterium]